MANVRQTADQMSLGFDCTENQLIADQYEALSNCPKTATVSDSSNVIYLHAANGRLAPKAFTRQQKSEALDVKEKILSSLLLRAKSLNW